MEEANTVIIVMAVALGIVLIFGIYKLATGSLSEHSALKTGTPAMNRRQILKTVLTILFTILLFLALFVTWHIFTSQ